MNTVPENPKATFEDLKKSYKQFYNIRDHPAPGIDYEDWREKLTSEQKSTWVEKLQFQAQKVADLSGKMLDLKDYRPYHELKSFLKEDVRDLEHELHTDLNIKWPEPKPAIPEQEFGPQ